MLVYTNRYNATSFISQQCCADPDDTEPARPRSPAKEAGANDNAEFTANDDCRRPRQIRAWLRPAQTYAGRKSLRRFLGADRRGVACGAPYRHGGAETKGGARRLLQRRLRQAVRQDAIRRDAQG